jgi:hypothetical protein
MALTRKDVLLLNTHTVVRHQRFGNEQAWSVTGGNLRRGQIVTLHAMCSAKTAIKKAIAQDIREEAMDLRNEVKAENGE